MVKVVEAFATAGGTGGTDTGATGASSTSPLGPRNIGLEGAVEVVEAVEATGGVGTILGGVKPWWLNNRDGCTTILFTGYWAMGRMGRTIWGLKNMLSRSGLVTASMVTSGGRVASETWTTLLSFFEYMTS